MKLTLKEILDGVDQSVTAQWEPAPLYRNQRPKEYARPSFLLEGGPIERDPTIGGGQVRVTADVRLVYFGPVDAYGNSKDAELEETMDAMMELFEDGYIHVGGRCPHVLKVSGNYGYDYAEVTAKLEFYDAYVSPRASQSAQSMMGQFHTKINDKEW